MFAVRPHYQCAGRYAQAMKMVAKSVVATVVANAEDSGDDGVSVVAVSQMHLEEPGAGVQNVAKAMRLEVVEWILLLRPCYDRQSHLEGGSGSTEAGDDDGDGGDGDDRIPRSLLD